MSAPLRATIPAGAALLFAASCDPEVWTERDQLRFHSNLSESYVLPGDPVLRGSSACLDYAAYRVADDPPRFEDGDADELRACYRESLRGPATFDGDGCIALDQLGQVELVLDRIACALPDTFGDDVVRFEVVGPSDVRAAFRQAVPDRAELQDYFDIEDPASEEPGVVARVGEPLYLIEGTVDLVEANVVIGAAPKAVAVTEGSARAVAVAGSPSFPVPDSPSLSLHFDAQAGDVFRTTLQTTVGELDVGEVHVVPRSAIAELTLWPSVVYLLDPRDLFDAGATAVARDHEGHVLREPPVTWSVIAGDYALETYDFDEDGRPDPEAYASIADACVDASPNERRSATLAGELDALRATTIVEWSCPARADDGCDCTAGRQPPPLVAQWLLLALLRPRRVRGPRSVTDQDRSSPRLSGVGARAANSSPAW